MTYHAEITENGSVPLPLELATSLGWKPGDRVSVDQSGTDVVIRRDDGRSAAIGRLRAAMKGYSVDRFLDERHLDSGE